MAEVVVSFVLDQLSIFLRESGISEALGQEVQHISDELGHMKAFLKVAEAKEDDPRLQEWVKQVRRRATGFVAFAGRFFKSRKTLREIRSIKSRIINISEARQRYESEYGGISTPVSGSLAAVNHYNRDDAFLVEEAKLVGIEKPKQHLISKLLDGDSHFKVISVVGMGGLGKTTLVKKVHEDPDVRRYFPIRVWVTVSQTFDIQVIIKNLIRKSHAQINKPVPQSVESMESVELKEYVKDFLQQQRYAIVFDDVWNMQFWDEIKFVLPESNYGNRVMLTTRNADVASASCIESPGYVYTMASLSPEESWILFCNRTFRNNCCPAHLKNVAQGILDKCDGLPLAIVAISGLLALKDMSRVDEWEMVQCSLGGELEGTGMLDRVKNIPCLSFNDLPSHLKACLLYISIFPEDSEILCASLIDLWIAERFVKRRGEVILEDVARGYLRELANRSLIQVTLVRYEGCPWFCRIHDLLREVILSKSTGRNMVTLTIGPHARRTIEKVRRLVILSNNHHHQENQNFDHLRSLITFGSMEPELSKTLLCEVLCGSSKLLLKVLDFGDAPALEEIPNEIFNSFHLKHLCLRWTRVTTVPKSIGNLQNLEYLDLFGSKVRELPMEILKLKKLRYLRVCEDVDGRIQGFKAPSNMGWLLALHTLQTIDVATENEETRIVEEIGKLRELRVLGITNLRREDGKELCSSLSNLTSLRELFVFSTGNDDEVIDLNHHHPSLSSSLSSLRFLRSEGRLEKMPEWMTCLQGLGRIHLWGSRLRENPLESLQHLPNLEVVYLNEAYQGEGMCFKAGGFLKLKELYLLLLKGLRWVRVEEGAMPRLQKLDLYKLPLLEELPFGIQHLTQLQKLNLRSMSSQLVEKLKNQNKESEDYRNIVHIAEIIISTWSFGTDSKWRAPNLHSFLR